MKKILTTSVMFFALAFMLTGCGSAKSANDNNLQPSVMDAIGGAGGDAGGPPPDDGNGPDNGNGPSGGNGAPSGLSGGNNAQSGR
jgi:hypothetical protein